MDKLNIEKELEIIKHRLKLLWYHGEASTYYGCWSSSESDLKSLKGLYGEKC